MSHYKQQELDFIHRTKTILKQYDKFQISKKEKFDTTLFVNCLVGLLILPQQYWFHDLPSDMVNYKEWGIRESDISFIAKSECKNIKSIARHLRNSLAHYRFKAFGNKKGEIKEIKFEDYKDGRKTFEATISVSNLKIFADNFSAYLIKKMGQDSASEEIL